MVLVQVLFMLIDLHNRNDIKLGTLLAVIGGVSVKN